MEEYVKIWEDLSQKLSIKISPVSYEMWVQDLKPIELSFGKLILVASMKNIKQTLNKDIYKKAFKDSIKDLDNSLLNDYVIITEDEAEEYISSPKKLLKEENTEKIENNESSIFNENYTFENFVVGASNNLAKAAAYNVAQNPGTQFNPLFIYGGVGLGKTHILHAIGNYIKSKNKNKVIIYTTTEQFINDYVNSINNNKNNNQIFAFREKYRKADVLMIDDIQYLSKAEQTREALFHTFNDLYQANKQIILTSDRHPKELNFLEERLSSRFQSGLTVDISSPDLETRIAIINKKALQKNFHISKSNVYFIAENIKSNIREIEGAISKVIFYCQLCNKDSADELEIVKEALKDSINIDTHILTIDTIVDNVCSFFNISKDEIIGPKKSKNIAIPRQISFYLIDDLLGIPLNTIGSYFGNRDHSTIIYGRNKIEEEIKNNNSMIKLQVNDIKNLIKKV